MKRALFIVVLLGVFTFAAAGEKYNFNADWLLHVGDISGADKPDFNDAR